jgi:hypothetical protein
MVTPLQFTVYRKGTPLNGGTVQTTHVLVQQAGQPPITLGRVPITTGHLGELQADEFIPTPHVAVPLGLSTDVVEATALQVYQQALLPPAKKNVWEL